jgi:hypothetical protein
MTKNQVIPYNPRLKYLAWELRKNSTLSEVLVWQNIKAKCYGFEFHSEIEEKKNVDEIHPPGPLQRGNLEFSHE